MSEHTHAQAMLDGLGVVFYPDGTRSQTIELRLTNDPDRDPPSLLDPVCYLDAAAARTLAGRLCELSALGERQPRRSGDGR